MAFARSFLGPEGDNRTFVFTFIGSVLCHLAFFAMVIAIPQTRRPAKRFAPSVINVSMVSLAAPVATRVAADASEAAVAVPQKKVRVKKTVAADVQPQQPQPPAVSTEPKKAKIKRSLKKKTYDSEKIVANALNRIEKDVQDDQDRQLAETLRRLKDKVATSETATAVVQAAGKSAGMPVSSGDSKKILELIDLYNAEIHYRIQKNWAFSKQLAGEMMDAEAVLVIEILPNGRITDMWFEKRSGSRYLDESATKAINKSNPLPPLPTGYPGKSYTVGVRFTPEGIR